MLTEFYFAVGWLHKNAETLSGRVKGFLAAQVAAKQ